MLLFTIASEMAHHAGDGACPVCLEKYPAPCPCGGLIHAEATVDADAEGNPPTATCCDRCARSED